MKQYLMALDQGTTSSRAILFDRDGNTIAKVGKEFPQYYPREGYVEHDAEDIFESQLAVAREALAKAHLEASDIAAIGITNQRETTVVFEKDTGKPICHAIVWQCRRTAGVCEQLQKEGYAPLVREKTGLPIDPYFSATKIAYILDHVEGARERAMRGELLFGTVDTWLIYRLTGGKVHATDPSNAARTSLFNIHTLKWDEDLLRLFRVPAAMLPQVLPSSGLFGETDAAMFGAPIPIAGVAGDQQAALFGQCCFEEGSVKNTYGTGGFLLMNAGHTVPTPKEGLLATVGWNIGGETTYVVEGSVFVSGAAVQWLRDGLKILPSSGESERIARSVPDSGGVVFVPAFVGLGAPWWNPWARGTVLGITRATTDAHLIRATLEAMAFQTVDVLSAMEASTGFSIPCLRVDGGASANNLLLQMQSDFGGIAVHRPASVETTARGASLLAGLAVGLYRDTAEIKDLSRGVTVFTPQMEEKERKARLARWHRAVNAALLFAKEE